MRFQDMNWMDVERYLTRDDRVVLITGACEQHGFLSLLTDVLIPAHVAEEACRREGVALAPPLPFGISPAFAAYPGTLSLRVETFAILVREVIEGLLAQGFRRVLVSNGHGGNTGVLVPLLVELGNAHPEARFDLYHWWRNPAVEEVARAAGLGLNHANWGENFTFTQVGSIPEGEKETVEHPAVAPAVQVRTMLGDGSFGGSYQAPDAVMEQLFAAAVDVMAETLRAL